MIFLSIIILLFTENFETPRIDFYLSNCNYKGLIVELEKNDYLNKGHIKKSELMGGLLYQFLV